MRPNSCFKVIPPTLANPARLKKPLIRFSRLKRQPFEQYSDIQFYDLYRVEKSTILLIEQLLLQDNPGDEVKVGPGRKGLSLRMKLLITLYYLGNGCSQKVLADVHGYAQSTISRVLNEMLRKISNLSRNWIRLPNSEERKLAMARFKLVADFPDVWGLMDGTHIPVYTTLYDKERYINRKGDPTINVQATIDHNSRFIDLVARWPGSIQDSRVFGNSSLNSKARNFKGYILADKGYPCKKFILTPLKKPRNRHFTQAEKKYNKAHGKTRALIERTFGQWKNKFRALQGLNIGLRIETRSIIACGVLWNIIKSCDGRTEHSDSLTEAAEAAEDEDTEADPNQPNEEETAERTRLISNYFAHS